MTAVTLGRALGKAYEPGRGMGTVFASDSKDSFTIQIDRTGERLWRHRSKIIWR